MAQVPSGPWAVLALGLLHLAARAPFFGSPLPSSVPPCVLEAVCPPAWWPPPDDGPDHVCPACPEAPPCPAAPSVCAEAAPSPPEEASAVGWLAAAFPGVLVALTLEAWRCARAACSRARSAAARPPAVRDGVAPPRRGAGLVEAPSAGAATRR